MNNPLIRVLQRTAAVLLLLAVLGGVGAVVAIPVMTLHRTYDDSIDSLRFNSEKLGRLAAIKAPLEVQIADLKTRGPRAGDLLDGKSEALAGAQLQKIAKQYIRRAGGKLESTQMLPTSRNEFFERVTVRVQLVATVSALQKTLYAIESNRPLLFVDSFEIKTKRRRQTRKKVDATKPVMLTVNFDMSGYRRSKEM